MTDQAEPHEVTFDELVIGAVAAWMARRERDPDENPIKAWAELGAMDITWHTAQTIGTGETGKRAILSKIPEVWWTATIIVASVVVATIFSSIEIPGDDGESPLW